MKAPRPYNATLAILAGGRNTRMKGQPKSFFELAERSILDRVLDAAAPLCRESILVTKHPEAHLAWDCTIVADVVPAQCSMAGLHAALFFANTPMVLALACDMPFVRPALLRFLLKLAKPGVDVVAPRTSKGLEPLCAVYSVRCLPHLEQELACGRLRIAGFFQRVSTILVPEKDLRAVDPDLESFFNVNTPQDLALARRLAQRREGQNNERFFPSG